MLLDVEEYKRLLKEKYSKVENKNTDRRYLHSLSVGKKAIEIVKQFGFDIDLKKIEIAGILHDYAKYETMDKFEAIVEEYNLDKEILNTNFKLLHAILGPYIIKKELGIDDEQILNAIKYHTTGSLDMDRFAEVIFVADLTEDLRTGEGFEIIKEYLKMDFNKALLEKIKYSLEKNPTELNLKLYKKYSEV